MSEFDGIKERKEGKKKMPVGMAALFIGLAVFGVVYLYLFSPATTGWTQMAQYERKVKEHEAAAAKHQAHEKAEPATHEKQEAKERGAAVYRENCAVCHGEKLEGGQGFPALTGPKFKYGGTVEDFVRVITSGTENGMPKFEKQLGAERIRSVAMYIHLQKKK